MITAKNGVEEERWGEEAENCTSTIKFKNKIKYSKFKLKKKVVRATVYSE